MYDTIAPEIIEDLRNDHKAHSENLKTNESRSYKDLYKISKIDPYQEIDPPKSVLDIANSDGSYSTYGTLGNFSVVTGKAKARKSFFIAIMVAAAICKNIIMKKFVNHLPENKSKILYFDTEQGRYHVQLALKRIFKMGDIKNIENIDMFSLRSFSVEERLNFIEETIKNTPNLGFVIIDGIRDLLTSINDEEQATKISNLLLKWTEELNIHIVTVLHQNKSDSNARGHIGTELINKAETVLSVTKPESNSDISVMEAQQCRNREPQMFAFEIDSEGLPIPAEDFEIRTESKSKPSDLLEMEDFKKFELLNEVYSHDELFSYSELVIQMKITLKNRFNKKVGNNRVKELITYCKNKNWLE
ncbi:MAG: AAA family ATPase, partial [Melioribacteraceae bacterium]|nr:AAA family ATPase [Melioribacteraceae bacterium]